MDAARSRASAVSAARQVLEDNDDDSNSSDTASQDEDDQYSDELSSSPSVPDANDIDFEHVYSLHSFLASVEGQVSVSKGDNLTLLDDSNSYWWLVRVLKTQAVGYIPAENIETPFERLARLNKHRNVDLSSATQEDHATGIGSAQARTRIVPAQGPDGNRTSPFQGPPGNKTVAFAAPTFFEPSDDEDDYIDEFEAEDDALDGFNDDQTEDDLAPEAGSDEDEYGSAELVEGPHRADAPELSGSDSNEDEDVTEKPIRPPQTSIRAVSGTQQQSNTTSSTQTVEATLLTDKRSFDEDSSGTRKISLTPDLARGTSPTHGAPSQTSPVSIRTVESRDRSQSPTVQRSPIDVGIGHPGAIARGDEGPRKLRKHAANTDEGQDSKKKKSGGMFSSLFRKKSKSESQGDDISSALSDRRISSPLGLRSPVDTEDAYLVEATSRQQQVEARKALYSQYGISRRAGDTVNSFVARSTSLDASSLSPSSIVAGRAADAQAPTRPLRPGSLLGSPSGHNDVPMLSVVRVFAGENVQAGATFKTVLLNESTTSADLLRQALQRFRLSLQDSEKYHLGVKDLASGVSQILEPMQHPLPLLERLNEHATSLPSVKRSSVGSISSLASNLSLNPAIERLGMSDFSDDSVVKIFLHASDDADAKEQQRAQALGELSSPTSRVGNQSASPGLRFAARLILHQGNLSHAASLVHGGSQHPGIDGASERPSAASQTSSAEDEADRQITLMLPANISVAETIETGLNHFGIVDGVVHGGDEVEDRLTRRKSISRVRYCLICRTSSGQEALLPPASKLLDAYDASPQMHATSDSSKAVSQQNVDGSLAADTEVGDDEPSFVLRNHSEYSGHALSSAGRASAIGGDVSGMTTPSSTLPAESAFVRSERSEAPDQGAASDVDLLKNEGDRFLAINAQRDASRAGQRAILSARKNAQQGIDLKMSDKATLRSSRSDVGSRVRYSYIDHDGIEMDVSDAVEAVWAPPEMASANAPESKSATGASMGSVTAANAKVSLQSSDILADAVKSSASGVSSSSTRLLEQRIERVLAKVQRGDPREATKRQQGSHSVSAVEPKQSAIIPTGISEASGHLRGSTTRPLYRFDQSAERLTSIVMHQSAPKEAHRALKSLAVPATSLDEQIWGMPLTRGAEAAARRWYGASFDKVNALDAHLDELLQAFLRV